MTPAAAAAPTTATARKLAEKACQYLTASTDPFHAVAQAVKRLEASGFRRWQTHGTAPVSLEPGGKYYYTVQHSTLVAFTVGAQYQKATTSDDNASSPPPVFHIVAGHSDSPNLRIKPKSLNTGKTGKDGLVTLGVECYGGGLWHTWLDRDLSVSGQVLVRSKENPNIVVPRLVQLGDSVARVSSLAIHLQSADERRALAVNKEDQTTPIVGLVANAQIESAVAAQLTTTNQDNWHQGQEPRLLQRIAKELQVGVDQIADWELNLYDTQPASVGGLDGEFLYSGRLDNLASVFCAVEALALHSSDNTDAIDMIVAFDHEEVGSTSNVGAASPVLQEALQRVRAGLGATADPWNRSTHDSFFLSIDQAHARHPNYSAKHNADHAPQLGAGIVLKTNSNQRYASRHTTSSFLLRELARQTNIPLQEFCVRNDCPCGSTIGPTISAATGLRVVDAGMPQLSMHSIREVMSVQDLEYGVLLFRGFFDAFAAVDQRLQREYDPPAER